MVKGSIEDIVVDVGVSEIIIGIYTVWNTVIKCNYRRRAIAGSMKL